MEYGVCKYILMHREPAMPIYPRHISSRSQRESQSVINRHGRQEHGRPGKSEEDQVYGVEAMRRNPALDGAGQGRP